MDMDNDGRFSDAVSKTHFNQPFRAKAERC
jgi:hypothetical protein